MAWKSTDGGRTFTAFRGAPGGDDYQRIWIDPDRPDVMLLAADQGAIVTVNGGETWSSWYNQPTAQFYHVSTDNAFPYRVCGGQQESGSACVQSRGDDGQITFREWHPVGVEEYGYVAPDPLDPDIVYGGKVTRYDRRTGQAQNVSPQPLRGAGLPRRPHAAGPLLAGRPAASSTSRRTRSGRRPTAGAAGTPISPDLTRKTWEVPPNVGKYRGTPAARSRRSAASSTRSRRRRSTSTASGSAPTTASIHVTARRREDLAGRDAARPRSRGRRCRSSTPRTSTRTRRTRPSTPSASTTCGRTSTARATAGRPGRTSTRGSPRTAASSTRVREDPKRRGLLFAGTEQAVYVSFDDGDRWQSLRVNMPATSIRDLVVKDDDLVVGHARPRLLDPRRHHAAAAARRPRPLAADAHLFAPHAAIALPLEQEHRHAAAARRAGGARTRRTAPSSTTT